MVNCGKEGVKKMDARNESNAIFNDFLLKTANIFISFLVETSFRQDQVLVDSFDFFQELGKFTVHVVIWMMTNKSLTSLAMELLF